ncbi:MAG: low affinity iron permease family protein [Burkholderiaceae bacterium]
MKKKSKRFIQKWEEAAHTITEWSGKPWMFGAAFLIVVLWAVTGPLFGFSDTWQLVINTGTTIITFLMVFLIQQTQNKDTQALELKLNEIVASIAGASNRLIDVENLTSAELATLQRHYCELAEMAKKDASLTQSHSIEEAVLRHKEKKLK